MNAVQYCFTCACTFVTFVFVVLGCVLLVQYGVPNLKHLLEVESQFVEIMCRLIFVKKRGLKACTYDKEESYFQCLLVLVSYEDSNSSSITAEMFRSYQDAMDTNFECSAYECANPSKIYEYSREVNGSKGFQCFYHPERLEYVYFDPENRSQVMSVFISLLFIILIPVTLYCIFCCCNILHKTRDNITINLKNGSYKNCKRLVKNTNVNRKVVVDRMKLSPLAVATKYGHIKIMDYLVSIGGNLKEESIFRSACNSENEEVIGWCLKKLPIIQTGTPLSTYLKLVSPPSLPLLKRMIDAGADVNKRDTNNWTPLHFACMNKNTNNTETNSQVIALLVKSGSISHQVIQETSNPADKWTPFTSLLRQKEYSLCSLLIEAGYPLRKDDALVYVTDLPSDIQHALTEEVQNPSSLLRMCRFGIRNIFQGIRVQQNLELLPLPKILIQFLKLSENLGEKDEEESHNDGTF